MPPEYVYFLYVQGENRWCKTYAQLHVPETDPVWWIKLKLTDEQQINGKSLDEWLHDWPWWIDHNRMIEHLDQHDTIAAFWLPQWDGNLQPKDFAATMGYLRGLQAPYDDNYVRERRDLLLRYRGNPFDPQELADYSVHCRMAEDEMLGTTP